MVLSLDALPFLWKVFPCPTLLILLLWVIDSCIPPGTPRWVSGSQNTTMHYVPVMSLRIHLLHKLQSSILLSLLFFLSVILDPCIPQKAALCGLLIACPPSVGLNETLLPPPAWVELIRILSEEAFLKSSTEAPDTSDVSKGFRARQMVLQDLL